MNTGELLVLTVDDEPSIREIFRFYLERKNYKVQEAPSGNAAFALLKSSKFDAILTDVRMDDGDGLELLDRIRAISPMAPIVFVISGYSDRSRAETYARGADAVFTKPVSPNELLESLRRALTPRRERWSKTLPAASDQLQLRLDYQSLDQAVTGGLVSLGRGGIFFGAAPTPLMVGKQVAFHVTFREGPCKEIAGTALVRFIQPSIANGAGLGLEYQSLSESGLAFVDDYLTKNEIVPYIPHR